MKNINKKIAAVLAGTAIITSLALAIPAFAQTNAPVSPQGAAQGNHYGQWMGRGNASGAPGMMRGTPPAAVGSVTAVSGTTLTVTGRSFGKNAATTTYTVDASSAAKSCTGARCAVRSDCATCIWVSRRVICWTNVGSIDCSARLS